MISARVTYAPNSASDTSAALPMAYPCAAAPRAQPSAGEPACQRRRCCSCSSISSERDSS